MSKRLRSGVPKTTAWVYTAKIAKSKTGIHKI
jgi:hypothetical protein